MPNTYILSIYFYAEADGVESYETREKMLTELKEQCETLKVLDFCSSIMEI